MNDTAPRYGVRTLSSGKYHLVTAETEAHLGDPAYNTKPLGDTGACGRLDAASKYPYVLGLDSMRSDALCEYCRKERGLPANWRVLL